MIPLGYMAKRIVSRPEWLNNSKVDHILSVSSCISDDFSSYVEFWRHNGFWFFDSPEIIKEIAKEHGIEISGLRWFYYEAHEEEYNADAKTWTTFQPEPSFQTEIIIPTTKELKGFDIITNTCGQMVECSPLSCNSIAEKIDVNSDCLIPTFDGAYRHITESEMTNCEPGPYRIVSVSEVEKPALKFT